MADVFISYKSARRRAARHLEQILIRYGYSVWFDHALVRGRDYEAQIQREIEAAKAVIVLWCPLSVESEAVRSEANYAKGKDKLVPLTIEPCNLPLFSTLTQYIDLAGAACAPRDAAFDPLFDDIERLTGKTPQADFKALREYDAAWRAMGAFSLARFPLEDVREPEIVLALDGAAPSGRGPDLLAWSQAQWEQLKQSTDRKRLKIFAETAHPYYAHEAQERIGELEAAEETARRQAAEEAEAKRKAEAERRRIEELTRRHEAEWQAARAADTIAALETFLAAWTGGPHVEEARRRLAELSAAAKAPPRPVIRTGQFKVMAGPKGQEKELWLTPGESVRDADFVPELVLVPPGKFWMGSSDAEIAALTKQHGDYFKSEGPRHEVTIGYPLLVGKYPVTFTEWDAFAAKAGGGGFMGIGGSKPHKPHDSGWGRGKRPVINVS